MHSDPKRAATAVIVTACTFCVSSVAQGGIYDSVFEIPRRAAIFPLFRLLFMSKYIRLYLMSLDMYEILEIPDSSEEDSNLFHEKGWGDGLPMIAPTRDALKKC
ncbi:MAG: hypothetical protein Ct9H90mP5_02120 [Acidimicrobiaceae bacterium]|nr:MAG: hypothetical protein Ct9H90mP5_02120 [Acidimicrobiaceae bacterium]